MIPLGDNIPSRRFPFVNYLIIGANFLAFFYELSLGKGLDTFITEWGAVPARVTDALSGGETSPAAFITLITSMFLHGGWLHILSNMLFLWIFGDNVEDSMGHIRYTVFYLLAGIAAGLAQVFVAPDSTAPGIGASGAIAGVLGAYLVMFPHAQVEVLIPWFLFFPIFKVPALLMLGIWFLTQFFNGVAALTIAHTSAGGVAWWAHIGGFVAGLLLVNLFRQRRRWANHPYI